MCVCVSLNVYHVCAVCPRMCMCVPCMCRSPQQSDRDVGPCVTGGCELPCGRWEPNLGPCRSIGALSLEPSLQKYWLMCVNCVQLSTQWLDFKRGFWVIINTNTCVLCILCSYVHGCIIYTKWYSFIHACRAWSLYTYYVPGLEKHIRAAPLGDGLWN